jgi:hypothetical protein
VDWGHPDGKMITVGTPGLGVRHPDGKSPGWVHANENPFGRKRIIPHAAGGRNPSTPLKYVVKQKKLAETFASSSKIRTFATCFS